MQIPKSGTLFQDGYRAMKAGEDAAFAVSPLPLRPIKTGITQIVFPVAVATVATQIPVLGAVASAAFNGSGDILATLATRLASTGLGNAGGAVLANTPAHLGIQTTAIAIGGAVSKVTLGAVGASAHAVGNLGATLMTGRTGIKVATALVTVPIADTIRSAQQTIRKIEAFISQAKAQVNQLLNRGQSVSEKPAEYKVEPVENGRELYMDTLKSSQTDTPNYEDLVKAAQENPVTGLELDRKVMAAAKENGLTPEQVTNAIAEGPHVQAMKNQNHPIANINDYLAHNETRYRSGDIPGISEPAVAVTKSPEPEFVPPSTKLDEGLTTVQSEVDQASVKESSREAEDFFIGFKDKLAQSRLDVSRLEIKVNGETVFGMHDGDLDHSRLNASNESMELMKKALTDTANFKGTMKVTQGGETLLHIENGRVIQDVAKLVKDSAKVELNTETPDSLSEGMYKRLSSNVKSHGLRAAGDIASAAIKEGMGIGETMDMMKNHNPDYQKMDDKDAQQFVANAILKNGGREQNQAEVQDRKQDHSLSV